MMGTIQARLLLGWMPEAMALQYLLKECVFDVPMNEEQALAAWTDYRQRVLALPNRAFSPPARLGLSPPELAHVARFMAYIGGRGPHEVLGLHKVAICDLVVHQLFVVTDRAAQYTQKLASVQGRLSECLPTAEVPVTLAFRTRQANMNTYSEIDLPHAEFLFVPDLGSGAFSAIQMARHVTAMEAADRAFLWAGYHRTFALASAMLPTATVPVALLAFARNVMNPPSAPSDIGGNVTGNAVDPLGPFGTKAPRFGDFFNKNLFMAVKLRKKKFQLQIRADLVALDEH